jgi:hypothetical protein
MGQPFLYALAKLGCSSSVNVLQLPSFTQNMILDMEKFWILSLTMKAFASAGDDMCGLLPIGALYPHRLRRGMNDD